ncbi:MAG: gliding motility-associated C-terminal domain-containing protein [Bacteroidetes bacterium]|nr:gliding motility-associated C-terminal domain-containing protein [Bacteroidota bacterium]
MKHFYKIISLALLVWLLNPIASRASHVMGSDLSYVCTGNNNYTVTLKIYRDCYGIDPGNSFSVELYDGCAGFSVTNFNVDLIAGPTEVSELCPSQIGQSCCANPANCPGNPAASPPTYPGVQMYTYEGTISLPYACNSWYLRTNTCCRNAAITNLANAGGGGLGFGIQSLINNTNDPITGLPYCNSSVAFSTLPVPFVCLNSLITYNNGAADIDGDSLSYTLINPLNAGYSPLAFTGIWSANQPMSTTPPNSFQFDSSNGQISYTCPSQEVDVFAIQVNEYRNGVLVGTTIRDMQVAVLPCTISIPFADSISNVTNGFQASQVNVIVCPGTPLTFDIQCNDPANHSLTLTSNINSIPSAIPGALMTQIGTGDSVTAHITWTPLPGDTGCHDFILTAENNDCPINGRYTRAYSICVFTKVQVLSASLTFCGTPVQLTATGGTNFTWTPSVGPNAVSNPLSYTPSVSPVNPTMYYFTSDCGTDSVFVNAAPPFVYDAGPGGTVCLNGQVNLNATTDNLYAPYTFQWVPSAGLFDPVSGLPNDTIPNPVASPLGSTQYKCYITGNNGCTNPDSLTVNISGAGPNIVAKAQPLVVCPGDLVNLNVVANPQSCGISNTPCVGHVVQGQIGTGTTLSSNSPTQYPTIYGHYQNSARHQFLYLQSELIAQIGSGGAIDSISFYMVHTNNNIDSLMNFEIKMSCTQATSLPVEPNASPPLLWQPNLVTVFTPKKLMLGTVDGWITHKLDFPYDWDGTSNLVIDICFTNPAGAPILNNRMRVTPTAFNSVYYSAGSTSQCGVTGTPLTSTKRPNTIFTVCVTDIDNLPISWTPNSGVNAAVPSTIHNPVSHPETPVIYHVDVTAANGCHTQDFVYVDVDTSVQFHAFPDDTFFCTPPNLLLTTTTTGSPLPGNNFVYEWRDLSNNSVVGNSATLSVTPNVSTDYLATLTGGSCVIHDTVHVVIGNNLPINLIIDSISCFGQSDGKIVAIAGGGTPPINYAWSNGPVIDSIQNLGAGTYTVSISDSQGCSGTAAATLSVPSQLTAISVAQNITCNGSNNGMITVTPIGGAPNYSYLWSPSEPNAATISGLGVGNYLVTVTDSRGCTTTSSASVTQPSSLVINTLSFNAITNGGNEGWAFVIANGGTPNYTYSWSTGSTNDTIQNLFAGTYYVTVCDANGCCLFDTAVVTDPPPIQLTFVTVSNLCFGYCNGTSTVSATGGISPYSFVWSEGTNGNVVSNLCAGVYIVTATDSAGVTVSGNINITEPTQISIVLDTFNITCFGANNGSVLATASGGTGAFAYNWNIGGAVNPNTNLGPGTYTVTATDANSCTAQSSWTAIEPPLLTVSISASTNVSCFGGNDGSATATVNGGTPGYTYAWSNIAATTNPASGFAANNQSVTVTDLNACTATTSFVITEPSQLTVSVTSVTNEICNGGTNGAIDVTAAGGTVTYTYAWSNLATTEDLNGVVAGNYLVTVTDSKNCTATTTATISEPTAVTISFTHTDPLCTGDATGTATVIANGGTPGYVYDWSVIPGANDNSTITNLVAGLYDVVVQDVNLCAAQGSVTLTNPPSLNAQLINKHEISCANAKDGSVEASVNGGTPPIGFVWNNSAITPIISNLAPGVYTVTVADNNGCDTILNTSFTAPPLIDIALLKIDSASCPQYSDASIHVEGTGGTPGIPVAYTYSTDGINFQSGELFENLSAGTYHLYIKDGQGCMKDTIVFVYEPVKPTLTILPQDSVIDLGKSITLVSNVSGYNAADINFYSWSPITGLNCGESSSVVASPYTHTLYNLVVNYLHDCSVSQTVTVYVGNGDDIFVPNAFSPNGDGNNDVFTVYGSGLAKANLKIFNRWGEKVFDSQNQWLGWDGTYKGVIQNPGVYTYYLEGVYLNGKVKEKKGTVSLIR